MPLFLASVPDSSSLLPSHAKACSSQGHMHLIHCRGRLLICLAVTHLYSLLNHANRIAIWKSLWSLLSYSLLISLCSSQYHSCSECSISGMEQWTSLMYNMYVSCSHLIITSQSGKIYYPHLIKEETQMHMTRINYTLRLILFGAAAKSPFFRTDVD